VPAVQPDTTDAGHPRGIRSPRLGTRTGAWTGPRR
jgi:hypothetical protein